MIGAPDRPVANPAAAPLATYEDLRYRDVFWASRAYEDACDRIALRALLSAAGSLSRRDRAAPLRLIEAGAGFGRLATEYAEALAIVGCGSAARNIISSCQRDVGADS